MSEKMREEFEAWAKRHNESLCEDEIDQPEDIRLDRQGGVYIWSNAESAWIAWKASRETLMVELPHIGDYLDTYQQGENRDAYIAALNAAINDAGVKTK